MALSSADSLLLAGFHNAFSFSQVGHRRSDLRIHGKDEKRRVVARLHHSHHFHDVARRFSGAPILSGLWQKLCSAAVEMHMLCHEGWAWGRISKKITKCKSCETCLHSPSFMGSRALAFILQWNSLVREAGISDEDKRTYKWDFDGSLATELEQQERNGDPEEEGIVWKRLVALQHLLIAAL